MSDEPYTGKKHANQEQDRFQQAGVAHSDRVCAAFDVLVEAFIGDAYNAELVASNFKQVCQRTLVTRDAHEVIRGLL